MVVHRHSRRHDVSAVVPSRWVSSTASCACSLSRSAASAVAATRVRAARRCGRQPADEQVPAAAAGRIAGGQPLPRVLVADDLDLGAVDGVAVRVIPVPVGVDDIAHRLGRERLQLLAQRPGAAGRHVGVDDQHVVVVDDDRGVAADGERAGADGVVHARARSGGSRRLCRCRWRRPAGPRCSASTRAVAVRTERATAPTASATSTTLRTLRRRSSMARSLPRESWPRSARSRTALAAAAFRRTSRRAGRGRWSRTRAGRHTTPRYGPAAPRRRRSRCASRCCAA